MKKQLWSFLVLLFIIAAIIASFATTAKADQPTAVTSNNTALLFLGNMNIAPVVYLDGTTPAGVAVDIVHALAEHITKPVEIKAMNWSEAQTLVAQGKADALIQINPTEERLKKYDFSDTLLASQFTIFTRSDNIGISGLSTLRGLRVGVESGGLPQQVLEKNPQILLTTIQNFLEGFKQLNEGTLDAVVVDYRVGSYVLATHNIRNIKVTGEPITSSYSSIAVKKGDIKLLNEINDALRIIKADGTYQKILDTWKPKEVIFQTREQISEWIYGTIILILFIMSLIAVIWIVTIKKELTRRKTAETKLKEQNSTLFGIINSANALIFSVDHQYRYTSFNQGHADVMKAIYGAKIEIGHSIFDYMTVPEDRETARNNVDQALSGLQLIKEAYSGEELRSRQYFQVSHSPIRSESKVIGVAVLAQDMTQRKQAEEALQESKERFRILFEEATDAILVYDAYLDRFIDANANAELLFGCEWTELIKYGPAHFFLPEQTDSLPIIEYVQNIIKRVLNGEKLLINRMIRNLHGDIHFCEVRLVSLPSAETNLIRASYIDITDRKRIEIELEQYRVHLEKLVKERTIDLQTAKNQAEKANMAKSFFLSSMSHELRTPLNAILGFTQILMRQDDLSAIQREQLQIIRSSGDHLLNLINDLLDIGRIETQKIEINHSGFNLPNAIREVLNIIKMKVEEKNLTLFYEPQTPLPDTVLGDERKIKQILLNILGNAVKYTQDGGIILRAWYPDISSGLFICEVEDSGIGIPRNQLEIIFEPFSHLSSEKKPVEGAGLGLSITKKLVELMQGNLQVTSEIGKGSLFRFEISLPPVKMSDVSLRPKDQITGYEGERKRVLVVDDNPANTALLVSLLMPLGFDVTAASKGRDAICMTRDEIPDLILLDLVMPEMDGLDIVRIFRNDPDLNQIPIIGISASVLQTERKMEFEALCDHFVGKPISFDDLLKKIQISLGITWIVVPASSAFPSPGESVEGERTMVIPPEQTLIAIISLVKRGMFSGELMSILAELQIDSRYIPFCEQIHRFSRNYDDERILSFIGGVRKRWDYHE